MVRRDAGFTLIELMVVAAIVGILALLAVQNYWVFKSNAYNSTAASDARNVAPGAQLVASEGGLDEPILLTDGAGGPIPELPGVVISPGILGRIEVGPESYRIEVWHQSGQLEYQLDSDAGLAIVEQ